MVFPTFSAHFETGFLSQISTLVVIGFSILINYWRKLTIYFFIVLSVLVISKQAFSFAVVQGGCGTSCMNNYNYYGQSWGGPGVYYYPNLYYHSFYGPSPYYFMPHGVSPYQPTWMNNCPTCGGGNYYNPWQNMMPNNQQYHGPGMPAS